MSNVWQWIKDYQGIVGAALNAAISTTIALFISRRVSEGGRIRFFQNGLRLSLWNKDLTPAVAASSFEDATDGQLIGFYHVYNGYGLQKTLFGFTYDIRSGRRIVEQAAPGPHLHDEDGHVDMVRLNPKDLKSVSVDIRLSRRAVAAILQRECVVTFRYMDEKNKGQSILVARLKRDSRLHFGAE